MPARFLIACFHKCLRLACAVLLVLAASLVVVGQEEPAAVNGNGYVGSCSELRDKQRA